MKPITEFPKSALRDIGVVLTDIDDTLTHNGMLPAKSMAALEQLSAAGLIVIPVTGRPAGWCDMIARMWPVDAVIGENGALCFSYDRKNKKMRSYYAKTDKERFSDRERLNELAKTILTEVPEAGLASDQDYRIADLAIDFCEDVAPLNKEQIERIIKIFNDAGATTKISSIHINAWFGDYDKLSTTKICLSQLFGIDMEVSNSTFIFVGDSPNDMPMFAFFQNSIGVANVRNFDLEDEPKWITRRESADGFEEITEAIISARAEEAKALL
jgi:HAD superfamily hydrolase (TIGR01484 family)